MGRQGRNGRITADLIHHVAQTDGVVKDILQKMGKLYEHLLRSEIIVSKMNVSHFTVLYSVDFHWLCVTRFNTCKYTGFPLQHLKPYPPSAFLEITTSVVAC